MTRKKVARPGELPFQSEPIQRYNLRRRKQDREQVTDDQDLAVDPNEESDLPSLSLAVDAPLTELQQDLQHTAPSSSDLDNREQLPNNPSQDIDHTTQQTEPLEDWVHLIASVERRSQSASSAIDGNIAASDVSAANENNFSYPYCDYRTRLLIQAILDDPNYGERVMVANKNLSVQLFLYRNVSNDVDGTQDPYLKDPDDLVSRLPSTCVEEEPVIARKLDEWWEADRKYCQHGNEALIQRTLMIQMINHHRFFLHHSLATSNCYGYSAEQQWACPPMPSRGAITKDFSTSPKPDLCVSFLPNAICGKDYSWWPAALTELVCHESSEGTHLRRAFPFLVIEAKTSAQNSDSMEGFRQCLNSASQGLHIMYEFIRETNPREASDKEYIENSHQKAFYERVRFFSVVVTSSGIRARVHRAVKLADTGEEANERIEPDYPLRFDHADFAKIESKDFTRQNVIKLFEKIIWGYGPVLNDILSQAAKVVTDKFRQTPDLKNQRPASYYRHCQPAKRGKSSSRAATPGPLSFMQLVESLKALPGSDRQSFTVIAKTQGLILDELPAENERPPRKKPKAK